MLTKQNKKKSKKFEKRQWTEDGWLCHDNSGRSQSAWAKNKAYVFLYNEGILLINFQKFQHCLVFVSNSLPFMYKPLLVCELLSVSPAYLFHIDY